MGNLFIDTSVKRLQWDLLANLQTLFAYPFMQQAFISATAAAIACGVVGWFVLARAQTYVAHTLTTVAFPGATFASLVGIAPLFGFLGFALGGAAIFALAQRRRATRSGTIAIAQVTFFALGYFFASLQHGFVSATSNALFGNLLTITHEQSMHTVMACAAVIAMLTVNGRRLIFASIDEGAAVNSGISIRRLSPLFLFILAIVVAVTAQITGALLVLALLIIPAAIMQQFCISPRQSIAASVVLGVVIAWLALALGYFFDFPVGFLLTAIGGSTYGITYMYLRLRHAS